MIEQSRVRLGGGGGFSELSLELLPPKHPPTDGWERLPYRNLFQDLRRPTRGCAPGWSKQEVAKPGKRTSIMAFWLLN